ncbi:MAG: NUDIX hydrolase, partial [Acidimicrobiia bacterium]
MPFCAACGAALAKSPPVACGSCGVEHWRNAKPCAGALVMRDGRLLLLRRATEPYLGRWDIPGGFCEEDEHPALTARREAREEVGLDVEITGFLGLWLDRYADPAEPERPWVTLNAYYHATAHEGAEATPDPGEASEVGWFGPAGIPDGIAFPGHAPAVIAAWRDAVRAGRTVTALPD